MKLERHCGVSSAQGKWILAATILASGMSFLMSTAVSVALPTIQKSLNTSISGMQWIINSYTLTLAVLILISGSLGDLYGRKRIFSYGIIVFVIGSLLSGFFKFYRAINCIPGISRNRSGYDDSRKSSNY